MTKSNLSLLQRLLAFSPKSPGSDRRASLRQPCSLGTRCDINATLETERQSAQVRNLSAGGISLIVDREFEPQTILSLRLFNTTRCYACSLRIRVVYSVPHPSGEWILGGAFTRNLTDQELEAFLKR
jgi:hypothetical protein